MSTSVHTNRQGGQPVTGSGPDGTWFSTGEVGRLVGLKREKVAKLCDDGNLPFHRLPGDQSRRRVLLTDLWAFATANKLPTTLLPPLDVPASVVS